MAKTKTPEELELEARVERRTAKRAELEARAGADPDGDAWHAEAGAKWKSAEELATMLGTATFEVYDPVPLPDFRSKASDHVKRPDVFGRYLVERDSLVVHDVYAAKPECGIDGIRNGTYFHFLSELLETVEEETPCAHCLGS